MYVLCTFLIIFSSGLPHIGTVTGDHGHYLVGRKQTLYIAKPLSQDAFLEYSRLSDTQHLRKTLKRILIPRVVGSDGHQNVRNFIVESLRDLDWHVEFHKFQAKVPILGKLHFSNIIAKLNPKAERFLTLACHYDSKYMPGIEFLGATDSAMPCAILLNLAHVLQKQLNQYRDTDLSLMLIFFDGEEAFEEWTATDSIYGARHLAKKWEKDGFIDRLDMLVLLDLIGAPDPNFYNFFRKTESWYARLIDIEERLSDTGLMENYAISSISRSEHQHQYFHGQSLFSSSIGDDHTPFLECGVPVLHIIPFPFPDVWHTEYDNLNVIDFVTSENIARIIRLFTLEYLQGAQKNTTTK